MKIGILQCDDVLEELQPEFGNYPDMLQRMFLAIDPDLEFEVFDVRIGAYPETVDACAAYVSTGSRHGVTDGLAWVAELEAYIRLLDAGRKTFVGVCFGHQALATALGGEVERSPRGWGVGVTASEIRQREGWMDPFQGNLDLVASHQDQISRLPAGVQVLAGSDFCPYYMVQCGGHFLGIQGHPEFSRDYSRALMLRRRGVIPDERLQEGLASLDADVDDQRVAAWILNFIRGCR